MSLIETWYRLLFIINTKTTSLMSWEGRFMNLLTSAEVWLSSCLWVFWSILSLLNTSLYLSLLVLTFLVMTLLDMIILILTLLILSLLKWTLLKLTLLNLNLLNLTLLNNDPSWLSRGHSSLLFLTYFSWLSFLAFIIASSLFKKCFTKHVTFLSSGYKFLF